MSKEAFVIPRVNLVEAGFIPEHIESGYHYHRFQSPTEVNELIDLFKEHGRYGEREGKNSIEFDPSLQQLIFYGYVLNLHGDGKFLAYERPPQHSDGRISKKTSLGLGGHVERLDADPLDSMYREIIEEADITFQGTKVELDANNPQSLAVIKNLIKVIPTGVIKDDRDSIGKVHFGVACQIKAKVSGLEIATRHHGEGGESTRYWYLSPSEYNTMLADEEIFPEGWADVIYKEEILKRK